MSEETTPFQIPPNYRIEPELQAPLPRTVPDSLRHHPTRQARHASARKAWMLTLALAVTSFFLRDTSFFKALGLYSSPLAYLQWICPVVVVICILALLDLHPWKKDPYKYLREGIPVVGQVVDLRVEVATRVNGSDSAWAYDVYFRFLHPDTDEDTVLVLRSATFGQNRPQLKCRVGDFLTAVYLPGSIESLTLYGFTDADPDRSLMEMPSSGSGGLALIGIIVGILGLGYMYSAYALADVSKGFLLALLPGVLLGGVLGVRHSLAARRKEIVEHATALEAGLPIQGLTHRKRYVFGAFMIYGFMGAIAASALLVGLNGFLDTSKAVIVPVEVRGTYVTTHNGIFNTYDVEYADPVTGKSEKIGVSPLELEAEGDLTAELVNHEGFFGWPRQTMRVRPLTEEELEPPAP